MQDIFNKNQERIRAITEGFEKGKALPIGTIRTHGGQQVIKTAQGWRPHKEGRKSTVQPRDPKLEPVDETYLPKNHIIGKNNKSIQEAINSSLNLKSYFLTARRAFREDAGSSLHTITNLLSKVAEEERRVSTPAQINNLLIIKNHALAMGHVAKDRRDKRLARENKAKADMRRRGEERSKKKPSKVNEHRKAKRAKGAVPHDKAGMSLKAPGDTKSDHLRKLFDAGYSTADAAKLAGTHYSQAHTVRKKHKATQASGGVTITNTPSGSVEIKGPKGIYRLPGKFVKRASDQSGEPPSKVVATLKLMSQAGAKFSELNLNPDNYRSSNRYYDAMLDRVSAVTDKVMQLPEPGMNADEVGEIVHGIANAQNDYGKAQRALDLPLR